MGQNSKKHVIKEPSSNSALAKTTSAIIKRTNQQRNERDLSDDDSSDDGQYSTTKWSSVIDNNWNRHSKESKQYFRQHSSKDQVMYPLVNKKVQRSSDGSFGRVICRYM